MTINYLAVLACAVLAMVIGTVWYGPLFGKAWMRLVGMAGMSEAECKEKQRKAMPLYALQFVLAFFQIFVFATYSIGLNSLGGVINALWIWLGFVMPTTAGTCIWTSDSRKMAWQRFFIQAGYQLVCFIAFGLILGAWN